MPNSEAEQQVELAGEQQLAQASHDASSRRAGEVGRAAANSEWLKPGMFIMKMPSNAKPRSTSSAAMRSAAGERRLGVVGGRIGVGTHVADGIANGGIADPSARR